MLKDSLAPDTTVVYSDKVAIEKIETELYFIPLMRPMVDAIHGVQREFSLVVVKVFADNGEVGMGYTYTVGRVGGTSIATLIRDNIAPILVGEDPRCIENIWQKMWWALHYVGRGGIAVFGMSAIDVALWDLKARMAEEPLWRLLGGHDNKVEAYGGGIDFDLSIEDLLLQTQGFLDAGLRAVKMKIGRDNISEDTKRIAAVRDYIGPDIKLMVDVNMKWSVDQALKACQEFAPFNLTWIEEPTIPDDFEGNRRIEQEGGIPVASGENLHTIYEFKRMIVDAGITFPDADVSNVGGISAFMKVAYLAHAHNRKLTTHGIQEMHVSCLAAIPNASLLEIHAFRIDEFLVHPLEIKDGYAFTSERIGHGVVIDWEKMARHRIG